MARKTTADNLIAEKIKSLLDNAISEVLSEKEKYVKEPDKDFTRTRKLDLETMIRLVLAMQGNSLPKELYEFFKGSDVSVTPSAFVQQRDKILPGLFSDIFVQFNEACADNKTYKGYHLYAADGSDINIAKNPEDETTYFEQGFNQIHLNAIFDIENKTYADFVIQPARIKNESSAAIEMVKRYNFPEKSILIADRGYEAANLYEHIKRTPNLDYLIRVKNAGTVEIRDLPMEELDIVLAYELRTTQTKADREAYAKGEAKYIAKVSWEFESPFKVEQRVVRFEIAPGEYETIVTSLPKEIFTLAEIKELYHKRWGIETSFRELKYAIGMINLHARKVEYIHQEIIAALIMYNFCERITMAVVICQKNSRKHTYQVNFTMAIHICRDFFSCGIHSPPDIVNLISRHILPVRPGRSDKRKSRRNTTPVFFVYRVAA